MGNKLLEVSELFGPTFQGEGPSVGQPAVFLRLRRCNLQCQWQGGNICDAYYTWKKDDPAYQDYSILTVEEIAQKASDPGWVEGFGLVDFSLADLFVISGGEPLIWRDAIQELLPLLPQRRIEIETNGTLRPGELQADTRVHFNVSPKLSSSGNVGLKRLVPLALREFAYLSHRNRAVFKFVVTRDSWGQDFNEIEALQRQYEFDPVYVMPEGVTAEQITEGMRLFAPEALRRGWRLSPRLHIYIWGNVRGH